MSQRMLTEKQAREFASHWIDGWNSHNLDAIMAHYDEKVVLTSPVAQKIMNIPSGTIEGKAALQVYFAKGLDFYPDLRFELIEVMWGINSVVVHYKNQKGTKVGEFMELNPAGKVIKVVVNYNS